jgi:hypothetical protein
MSSGYEFNTHTHTGRREGRAKEGGRGGLGAGSWTQGQKITARSRTALKERPLSVMAVCGGGGGGTQCATSSRWSLNRSFTQGKMRILNSGLSTYWHSLTTRVF